MSVVFSNWTGHLSLLVDVVKKLDGVESEGTVEGVRIWTQERLKETYNFIWVSRSVSKYIYEENNGYTR